MTKEIVFSKVNVEDRRTQDGPFGLAYCFSCSSLRPITKFDTGIECFGSEIPSTCLKVSMSSVYCDGKSLRYTSREQIGSGGNSLLTS